MKKKILLILVLIICFGLYSLNAINNQLEAKAQVYGVDYATAGKIVLPSTDISLYKDVKQQQEYLNEECYAILGELEKNGYDMESLPLYSYSNFTYDEYLILYDINEEFSKTLEVEEESNENNDVVEKETDSDNDGVADVYDICTGGNDTIDLDYNGVPDDCDLDPSKSDTDKDGVADVYDVCIYANDLIDDNVNGIPDCLETIDYSNESANSEEVVEDAPVENTQTPPVEDAPVENTQTPPVEDGNNVELCDPNVTDCVNSEEDEEFPSETTDEDGDGVADPIDVCSETPSDTEVDGTGCPLVVTNN